MNFNGLIDKEAKDHVQMAWELELFRKIRDWDDGLSVVETKCDFSWYKGDHQPSFELSLVLFNWTIFQLLVYNIKHVED
jgi:hypothetical protein